MKKKFPYLLMTICMAVASAVCTFVSYYSVGVVQRANVKYSIDERIDKMISKIEWGYEKEKESRQKICENYKSRARMTALMVFQNNLNLSDENTLEQLRIAINADEISISDSRGIIEYSTTYYKGEYVQQEFLENISDKNYTDAVITKNSDNEDEIIVATSRMDKSGIIQLLFNAENIEQSTGVFNISDVASGYTVFDSGCMAVIDLNSYTYLSHTNDGFTGKIVQIPAEEFNGNNFTFYSYYKGEKSIVRYKFYNDDKIILGIVPLSNVYSWRNAVTAWVAIISIILSIVAFLAMRKYIIDENKQDLL